MDRAGLIAGAATDLASFVAARYGGYSTAKHVAAEEAGRLPGQGTFPFLHPVQVQAAARSLRLETRLPEGNLCVDCDADRVSQVLANLLGNAIKFTEPGGTIIARVEPRGNEVCFSVADTGPGIPHADLPRVFDRFWRASDPAHKGTGLGLSIA